MQVASFFKNIKLRYDQGSLLIKIIFINLFVFVVLTSLQLISTLFKLPLFDINQYIGLPANVPDLLTRPWTLVTYMFVHYDFFHLLFNMILLYVFGRIFLSYFSLKNLGGLYFLGGLSGALLYIVAFNTIPYYLDLGYPTMVGASASVTAIIFASAFYRPHLEVSVIFIKIKIIYVALFILVLDCIDLGSKTNPGGHVAHIGGAIVGYLYARQYLKGKDITRWLNSIIDWVANIFKPSPRKMKVKYKRAESDYDYNKRKHNESAEIDAILDKLKESGYTSLSKDEKKRLFDASKK